MKSQNAMMAELYRGIPIMSRQNCVQSVREVRPRDPPVLFPLVLFRLVQAKGLCSLAFRLSVVGVSATAPVVSPSSAGELRVC